MKSSATRILLAAAVLVVGGTGWVLANEEPTPTPVPQGDQSLSDVAGGIKLNRSATGGSTGIVISNENLADLAGQGHVTEVTKPGNQSSRGLADVQIGATGAGIEGQAPGYAEEMEKKQYWQAVYEQQLKLLQDISKQIEVLDYEIPGLWRDFYAWDDPAYRDGVIKPKLDEALAQRQKLEVDKKKGEASLVEIKKSAQRDGGQPGWFRGFDKPPTPRPTTGVMPP
jgi:hypothetical protein